MKRYILTIQSIFLVNLFLIFGISNCVHATILYGSDAETDELYRIDTTTAESVKVGVFGAEGYMAGLAYDSDSDIMYGTTTGFNNLYSIDYLTGNATLIGKLNAPLIHGLAYDNSTDTLYGISADSSNNHLYQIDVITGNATMIGNMEIALIGGLAVQPETYDLYGVTSGRGGICYLTQIDKNTGTGTLLYQYNSLNWSGLTFSPDGTLYATNNWTGNLYTIDLSNGSTNLIGNTGLQNALGLTSIPEPATLILFGLGGFGLFSLKKRKQK